MDQDRAVDVELTRYVAEFVVETRADDLSAELVALGKKSILDGLGFALSGAVARSGDLVRRHLDDLGLKDGVATVIGGGRKVAPRFAAFANGVGIHADDYDDTQLAVAKDRVYGLLTHPTAPALPAALAIAELVGRCGARSHARLPSGRRGRVQDRGSDRPAPLPDRFPRDGDLRHLCGGGGRAPG